MSRCAYRPRLIKSESKGVKSSWLIQAATNKQILQIGNLVQATNERGRNTQLSHITQQQQHRYHVNERTESR